MHWSTRATFRAGLVWALWHVWVDFRQNFNTMVIAWFLEFAIFYVATLTAYRLLMTWVELVAGNPDARQLHGLAARPLSRHFVQARPDLANRL